MGIFDFIGDFVSEVLSWIGLDFEPSDDPGDQGRTVNKSSAVEPIPVVYGLRRLSGTRVFLATGGPDNKYLWLAIALCEGEIQGIRQVWIDGKPISAYDAVFAQGHTASAPAGDRLAVVHWYRGTTGQRASALLRQAPGWTTEHRLRGVAYLACRFRHSADVWRGVPRIEALVQGRRVFDPRDGSTRYSTNAALIIRDYLTHGIYGGGRPDAEIDDDALEAAADDAEASETYLAGSALPATSVLVTVNQCCRVTWRGNVPAALRPGTVATWINPLDSSRDNAPIQSVDRIDEALDLTGEPTDDIGDRWRWTALAAAERRVEAMIEVASSEAAGFRLAMTAGEVTIAASGRHEINAVIDTGKPLIENVRALLSGCRGMLPWVAGKYTLVIERDRPPVMDIGPDHLVAGVSSAGPKKRDLVNRASARYVDPAREWKETEAIWPTPGGSVDTAMLAQDGGERLSRDLRLPTVTSRPQALDLARIVTLRMRSGRRSQARGTPALLPVTPGDVVRISDATLGWVNKPQLVLGVAHQYGGEVVLACVDHDADVYDWEDADLLALHDDTERRNPLIVPAMAGLTLEVVLDRVGGESGGDPVQWLIGATARWTAPAAADVVESLVSWRASAAGPAPAGEWETKPAPAGAASADILPLRKDVRYDFRGMHRNAYGARSPWSPIVALTIDRDITAPDPPSGLTLAGGPGLLAAAWTPPASAGFSHVEWELRRFDAGGAVAETIEGKHWGTSAALGGLPPGVKYDLRMRSVDDAGNKSGWTGRVQATTLEAEAGGPAVHHAISLPLESVGAEGDTWITSDLDGRITSVHGRIGSVWVRLSGNPLRAAWSAGDGTPSGGAVGEYYADRGTANVWIRYAAGWHWAIDLDPSGQLTWRFGRDAPTDSTGADGERAYAWRTGIAYERANGTWTAFANLAQTVGNYGTAVIGGYYPRPCDPRTVVSGGSVEISWCAPRHPARHADGSPARLAGYTGAVYLRSGDAPAISRTPIVAADTTAVVLSGLAPNETHAYAIFALYGESAPYSFSNVAPDGGPGSASAGSFGEPNNSGLLLRGAVGGAVAIGDVDASVTSLTASGDATVGDVTITSDRALKDDVAAIRDALGRLGRIGGYTYTMGGRRRAGVIAQELEDALPEAVRANAAELLTVSPLAVIALLVEAVKELEDRVDGIAEQRRA